MNSNIVYYYFINAMKWNGHILSCSKCSRSDLGMLWECSEDGLEMFWRCSGNTLGCFDNALGVLWVNWTQGTFLQGQPGSLCIFEIFTVSRDTQSNLGFSRTKPLFPDGGTHLNCGWRWLMMGGGRRWWQWQSAVGWWWERKKWRVTIATGFHIWDDAGRRTGR